MQYSIKNKLFELNIDATGLVLSAVNDSGENVIEKDYFAKLVDLDKKLYNPVNLEYKNGAISIEFENGVKIGVKVVVYDDFMTFTLISASTEDFHHVKFCNLKSNIDYDKKDSYAACLMGLTMATHMKEHPGFNEELSASAYPHIGLFGNSRSPYNPACAIIICKGKDLRDIELKVMDIIPDGELIKSSLGGPNAKNAYEICKKTYTLQWTPITEKNYDETVAYFKEAGLEVINLHHMQQYSQGSFTVNPDCYPGGLEEYKNIVKRLHSDGFKVGLHPYVFFINPKDSYVHPIPHDDIDVLRTFTLAKDISLDDSEIYTAQSLEGVTPFMSYVFNNSQTLRIDNELLKFKAVDESGKFYNVERGVLGTEKSEHKAGAKISQYKEFFYYYMAKAGSKLFYEIAKNMANFYNEVGFDAIYFDAIDGVACLDGDDYAWYHAMDFIREFYSHIDHDPIFDCCHNLQYTSTWYARSRFGAIDRARLGYQEFKDAHMRYNKKIARRMGVNEELGWCEIYFHGLKDDYFFRTMPVREEDIAYVYSRCMATGACSTFLEVLPDKRNIPVVKEHWSTIRKYTDYRNSHTLNAESIEYLNGDGNYALIKDNQLKKANYNFYRFEHEDKVNKITNPYEKQKPFIRIENLYSASDYDCDGAVVTTYKTLNDGDYIRETFDAPFDATQLKGLGIWVKGDGGGGLLTVSPRAFKGNSPTKGDHYIRNDFIGWKYFRAYENENGEQKDFTKVDIDNTTYETVQEFYAYYVATIDYSRIEAIDFEYKGKGSVEVKPVKFLPHTAPVLKNPTLNFGGTKLAFEVELNAGETLECDEYGNVRVIDVEHNILRPAKLLDNLVEIESGETDLTFSSSSNSNVRVRITLGLVGEDLN